MPSLRRRKRPELQEEATHCGASPVVIVADELMMITPRIASRYSRVCETIIKSQFRRCTFPHYHPHGGSSSMPSR
jgi:hypothetical protein